MKCPYCNNSDTKVIDSRPVEDGLAIRRRRECEKFKKRFTTFEKIENSLLVVVKNDGRRESFDRNKLINGLLKACEKTKITYEDVEKITVVDDHTVKFQLAEPNYAFLDYMTMAILPKHLLEGKD